MIPLATLPDAERVDLRGRRSPPDQVFRVVLIACASVALIVVAGIVGFLFAGTGPAWRHQHFSLFTSSAWNPVGQAFGFKAALVGSAIIGTIALVLAFPISLAMALAINEYAPRWARPPLTALIDLLAALPSLLYGLWGLFVLNDHLHLTQVWLGRHASFFPLFRVQGPQYTGSLFLAGIIVAIMILPLMTSVSREVMSQVPREDCEAALALGGTRWGMISTVVLPFGRNGIVGGAMLGLGRALGETVAVSLVLSANDRLTSHILQPGGESVSALIVREFNGAGKLERSALTVAGLTLFAGTLAINLAARLVVARSAKAAKR